MRQSGKNKDGVGSSGGRVERSEPDLKILKQSGKE